MKDILQYKDYIVSWLKKQVADANLKGVLVGLSGGVDSSVVAAIAKEAFPENSLAIYIPIGDMGQDLIDAKLVAKTIGIKTQTIDLTSTYQACLSATGVKTRLANANIKPRLRMTSLYAVAQEKSYLVLGTDNAPEWELGYFTKYGDGGVDLLPIVHLFKQDVKNLAKVMGLPEVIYTKQPTAALWPGQTDEAELGFSYDQADAFLAGDQVPLDIAVKIRRQMKITEHKRACLPTPLSPKAFFNKKR